MKVNKHKSRAKKNKGLRATVYMIAVMLVSIGLYLSDHQEGITSSIEAILGMNSVQVDHGDGSNLEVHFLDVGQALSIYITDGKGNDLLYDAGNNGDGAFIVSYLQDHGVDDLEYLINSHPHEDHLGGMDTVLENFDAEVVIMSNKTYDTKAYMDVVTEIVQRDMKITDPNVGDVFEFGSATIEVIGPLSNEYKETNDYSIVLMVHDGEQNILLTGDAEAESEHEIINSKIALGADVLQVGHHGSITSSTAQFVKEIAPLYSVISCGKDNDYAHPDNIIVERLGSVGSKVYRTDEDGTVVIKLDGHEKIEVVTLPKVGNPDY